MPARGQKENYHVSAQIKKDGFREVQNRKDPESGISKFLNGYPPVLGFGL